MKCPECGTEMEEGILAIYGGMYQNARWEKASGKEGILGEKVIGTHRSPTRLSGFRCRSCGSYFFR